MTTPARSETQQLRLSLVATGGEPSRARLPRNRNARMALRLESLAQAALDEAADLRLAGRARAANVSEQRAADARRAAEILRGGSAGVGDLLAS